MGAKPTCSKPKSKKTAGTTNEAAKVIQRAFRSYRARQDLRFRAAWKVFEALGSASEKGQIKLFNFYRDLCEAFPVEKKRSTVRYTYGTLFYESLEPVLDESLDRYNVTPIKFPLDRKGFETIYKILSKEPTKILPASWVNNIVLAATKKFQQIADINFVSTKLAKQATVVGSLHGKISDLLTIFRLNGMPSVMNPYVFNGDMVDYGKNSVEVFTLIMACVITFPNAVYVNRGDHEDLVMNARYGFVTEISEKYFNWKDSLLKVFENCYRWIPLATIISNEILVINGGITHGTNIMSVREIPRECFDSVLCPSRGNYNIKEWDLLLEVLWNCPQADRKPKGVIPMQKHWRLFTLPDTETFLRENKYKLLITSQACLPEGYKVLHNGQVLAVSSGSSFYGPGSNKGAYITFQNKFPTNIYNFSGDTAKLSLTISQKVQIIENAALEQLILVLSLKKKQLADAFESCDNQDLGFITLKQWCACLSNVSAIYLPWQLWLIKLAQMKNLFPQRIHLPTASILSTRSSGLAIPDKIDYKATLNLLENAFGGFSDIKEITYIESLYKNIKVLQNVFHILDVEQCGQVSMDNFIRAMHILENHLPEKYSAKDLGELFKLMDSDGNRQINLNEFLETFRLYEELKVSKFCAENRVSWRYIF